MTQTTFHRLCALALLALTLAVQACSDSDPASPDDQDPGSSNAPGVGSTYTFKTVELHPVTGVPIAGTAKEEIVTLTSNSENYRGRNPVTTMLGPSKIAYLHYQADGDVEFFYPAFYLPFGPASGPVWATAPFGTKGRVELNVIDSSYVDDLGEEERFTVVWWAEYERTESITVKKKTFTAIVVKEGFEIKAVQTDGTGLTQTNDNTLWYVPELGYFTRSEATISLRNSHTSLLESRTRADLIDYTLK